MVDLTEEQFKEVAALLADRWWRLCHLYWIVDVDGRVVRFVPNWAQQELYDNLHHRNDVLKVRQLGISTFAAILELDACLFTENITCGVIDRSLPEAKKKMAKMRFAYDHLDHVPEGAMEEDRLVAAIGGMVKEEMKGCRFTTEDAAFPNGSTVYVGTSLRGGTLQILHISELGAIAAHDPKKAEEIISGGFNTVHQNGVIIKESTHEGGQYGLNYELTVAAMDMVGKELTPLDFRFFFFSWIRQPGYRIAGGKAPVEPKMVKYFASLEEEYGIVLDDEQKCWYAAMARTQRKIRQEFPTVPDEALNPVAEGTIFGSQINMLRELGRLTAEFEADAHLPVYTAWDIGLADFMSIWWIQPGRDGKFYVLDNYTANGRTLDHYIGELREREATYGRVAECFLPHDGGRRFLDGASFAGSLEKAGYLVTCVKRTQDLWASVDATRQLLRHAVIHARCSQRTVLPDMIAGYLSGVDALSNYRTAPPGTHGVLRMEPLHDVCSHAADALRTFAEACEKGLVAKEKGWKEEDGRDERRQARMRGLARGAEELF